MHRTTSARASSCDTREHLAFVIHRAQVDDAFHPEHTRSTVAVATTVLARAGLGDDARLAHALGQQILAQTLLILCAPV